MYEHILLPTDGSEGTERAVENAIDLAKTYGASLHVLYAVEFTGLDLLEELNVERFLEELEARGAKLLEDVEVRAEDAGVTTVTTMVRDDPRDGILTYIEENDIDLVVMGTHGRSGLSRLLLGSVTDRIVREADVPVLVVRKPEE
ncbi:MULTISPECIES: universal stress protein [unclassified Haladaptatus]|uniref:universal stress protein n=1 Tax=unclassified Haladaptatus TaxID=2622732 RepID=UPI0023E82C41|nr:MULTISPECIES: universal stress protein [unclassified Haladaptatus]